MFCLRQVSAMSRLESWMEPNLYVILDIFSRYVVGWMVADRESTELDGAFVPAGLGLVEDGALVRGSEQAAFRSGRNFRVGDGGRRGAVGVGSSSAPVGLASLALPTLRV